VDSVAVEELRSRIVKEIGRDTVLITSEDKTRHFDGGTLAAYYAGGLLLAFLSAAGGRLWEKIKGKAGEAGVHAVDVAWDAAAKKLSSASDDAEKTASDAKQVARIIEADSALQLIAAEVNKSYMNDFIDAGQAAVEARLRRDHFSEKKARQIAAAVTREVKERIGSGRA
jgi:hypothetical protein